MRIFKVLLSVVFAGVLLVGCKGGEKTKEASQEAVHAPSAGSVTVADIWEKKDDLNGKKVTVSGKVVKVNIGIMGKNWIHLQDGTGGEKTNDITITTDGSAQVDEKVVVSGIVTTNKDFGSGYKYDVIIEQATVTVE